MFVRAVELKSLSAAARDLGISAAAASHRIRQLEDELGARLLHRTTRNLQPTSAGQIFYKHALAVLSAVEDAKSSMTVASGITAGQLRIGAPLHFGRRFLAAMVSDFRAQHPKVEVTLRLSDYSIDMLSEAVDVAIRLATNLPDSSFVVRKLADCPRLLCASPAYLDQHGRPETPEDLRRHSCLVQRLPGETEFRWTLTTADGAVTLPVSGHFDADDGDVLTEWALKGEGIVLKPFWEVADQIGRGELEPVLPGHPPEPLGLYLLYPHRHQLPARVRVFSDFLAEQTKSLLEGLGGAPAR